MLPICIRILSQKTKKGISPSEEFCIIIVGSPDQNTYSFVSDFLLFDASKRWQDSAQRSKGPPILLNCWRAFWEPGNHDFLFLESGNQPQKFRECVIWKSFRQPRRVENHTVMTGITKFFSVVPLIIYFPWAGNSTQASISNPANGEFSRQWGENEDCLPVVIFFSPAVGVWQNLKYIIFLH